jgi:SAM-dependent methyltransferase
MKTELDPSSWVVRFGDLIPEKTPVLDVACGNGRHTRLFLERGHSVTAIDIDLSKVQDLTDSKNVELVQANLEDGSPWPFANRTFGAVIITNYLYRPLFSSLIDSVAPDGLLIYETFAIGHEAYGPPSRPEFLLKPGELIDIFKDQLQIIAYEHGYMNLPKPSIRQRICAIKSSTPLDVPF